MNLDERNNQSRGVRSFRTILDLAMGSLYILIGCLTIYLKSFIGIAALQPTVAYLLGGLFILYGGFRLYLGARTLWQGKR